MQKFSLVKSLTLFGFPGELANFILAPKQSDDGFFQI